MGGFYGSTQIRTTDRDAVKAAAEGVANTRKIHCLIGPELNGWVGIYPEGSGQDDGFAQDIAQQIDADVLHLLVHDDDVLAYWLWRKHDLVDSYWSAPGCLGEENLAEEQKQSGNPEQFRPIIGDKADRLAGVLDREKEYTFEGERLGKLAKLLGISNAVTAYNLLVGDERDGIKDWRKFEKIPPDPPAAAKPKVPSAKSIREKLKKSGLLLYSQEWKEFAQLLHGFPMSGGFILGWVNPWQKTAELSQFSPPQWIPEPLPFDEEKAKAKVQGTYAVVDSGDTLRIMDKSSSPWKLIAEIPQIDHLNFAAISSNGEFVAHSNQQKIIIRKLPSGDRIYQIPRSRSGHMAFHPTEGWLVASGDTLGLFRVDGTARVMDFRVGGNAVVVIDNIRRIEEPDCVGFSRDGRFLWCGTNVGMRIYEWEPLSSGKSRKPRWQLRLQKQVTAIAEEADGTGIVFGTFAGKLARFDLQTGELHKLADLPNGGRVKHLMFSADWNRIAVSSELSTQQGRRSMPSPTRAWEIWDYGKLRQSAKFLARAGEKQLAPPAEAATEDLSRWRRVSAKGRPR